MAFDVEGNPIEGGGTPEEEQQGGQPTPEEVEELSIGDMFDRAEAGEGQEEGDPGPEPEQFSQDQPNSQPKQPAPDQPHPTYKVVVAGQERELTQEQLNHLAEQNAYFAEQQELVDNERMRFQSMEHLAQVWETDPRFREFVSAYQQNMHQPYPGMVSMGGPGDIPGQPFQNDPSQMGMQFPGQNPGQFSQEQPLPEDPLDALIEKAARKAVQRIQGVQEEQTRLSAEQVRFQEERQFNASVAKAQRIVQGDEMKGDVLAEIAKFAPEGSVMREQMRNPRVFFPAYAQVRDRLLAARQGEPSAGGQSPQPTRVQHRAPFLEGGGGDVPNQQPTQQERARALSEKAAEGDLMAAGEMFDLFGG